MARKLTDKQMLVLRFIYDYIKSNDCAPAIKEIAKALDIPVSAAHDRIQHLFGHGCLRKSEIGQWRRNVALTEKGILACEGKMTTEELQEIIEQIKNVQFLLDKRNLDSLSLQTELSGLHQIIVRLMDESATCGDSDTRAMLAKIEYKAQLSRDEILKRIAVEN